MVVRPAKTSRRHATAAVEFALCAPFLLMLLLGVWEVGRMCEITQILENAAREGVRQAAIGSTIDPANGNSVDVSVGQSSDWSGAFNQKTTPEVRYTVNNYLVANGLAYPGDANVAFTNLTDGTKLQPSTATSGDLLRVSITYPKQYWAWLSLTAPLTGINNLTGSAVWASAKDKNLSVDIVLPLQ